MFHMNHIYNLDKLLWYVSSDLLVVWRVFPTRITFIISLSCELSSCVSSNFQTKYQRISHRYHICNWFVLHGVPWYVSSNILMKWRIFHNNHICDSFVLCGFCWCVSSEILFEWGIFRMNYICNCFFFHELSWCVSSDFLMQWMSFHKNHTWNSSFQNYFSPFKKKCCYVIDKLK